MTSSQSRPLIEVSDLVTRFHTHQGVVTAVDGLSFSLDRGEALAIVGESGSGKTVSALSLMGLIATPPGVVEAGKVLLDGVDLLTLPPAGWRAVRGRRIAMIFQDPMTSLNPVLTVGYQLTEALRLHLKMSRTAAIARALELLNMVEIPDPAGRMADYPHQFSGGQRQRIMIAMALSCDPALLIADEPTTALDVTIQAQIVNLVKELQRRLGMAILWITHDLAVVAGLVDRVGVMYAGALVEIAPVGRLYASPRHPYTQGLLGSIPVLDGDRQQRLVAIDGRPPDVHQPLAGCPFAPRCALAVDRCRLERPLPEKVGPDHFSACWRHTELAPSPERGGDA